MSSKKPKATQKRMISCFAQIVQEHIPGWKIEQIASGEKVKERKFSYSSQVYLLMLSQFLHLFSLNEIVDISKIYAATLSRVRGITPANLNTFSNANRTRNPTSTRPVETGSPPLGLQAYYTINPRSGGTTCGRP